MTSPHCRKQKHKALYLKGEHSPFVTITIDVATGWFFEDGYAKEAARYFQTA